MLAFENISTLIAKRRSVFPPMYTEKEITDETILAILENANWAPTHRKTEPWRFKVFKGESLAHLGDYLANTYRQITPEEDFSEMKFKKTKTKIQKSAAVIAICMARDLEESVPEWEEIAAVSCAVQNMWLTCTSLEIGSYWSTPKAIYTMNEFLGLKDNERCLGLFYMGYKKEGIYESSRGDINEKVEWL